MDEFNRKWIIENTLEEIRNYEKGILTIRGLHYRLVSRGMTNTTLHYKRVVAAMTQARWEGKVDFDTFSDNERDMVGTTAATKTYLEDEIQKGKEAIESWMNFYSKNRWENQDYYPEVFIEKKALQGVFDKVCRRNSVALGPCKGYPSLTFLNEAEDRFRWAESQGKIPIILYFGDYDPSGEDIPRSLRDNIERMGTDVEVRRITLLEQQVIDWNLPPAPIKPGDSRSGSWEGLGQVELDAVEPRHLQRLCQDAINDLFNPDDYRDLIKEENEERGPYQAALKKFVENL